MPPCRRTVFPSQTVLCPYSMFLTNIAAAQSASIAGDIPANVRVHLAFADVAAREGSSLLVFPELSLTGYELGALAALTVSPQDAVLAPLRRAARTYGMTIVAGAPVRADRGGTPAIGALLFHADGSSSIYRKRFLHAGEAAFATPGIDDAFCIDHGAERIALAICADTAHTDHPRWAVEHGATVYVASVLWSPGGYAHDAALMRNHVIQHGFAALVANHASASGGIDSVGRSAFWRPDGSVLVEAPGPGNHLVIASRLGQGWAGRCRPVDAPAGNA